MKQRECEHKTKTVVMWGPNGNRIPTEGELIDPFPAVCEKCGKPIRLEWLAESETVVTEKGVSEK